MKIFDWQRLLTEWNHVVLNSKLGARIPVASRQLGWLGHPPATNAELVVLEQKINHTLPPSYRQFLAVTNGWALLSVDIGQVWSLREVAWFAERNLAVVEALEDIDQATADLMRVALEVSEYNVGGAILLNPTVMDADGEWQAVRLHDTDPPQPYDNFWALMNAEFKSLNISMALAPAYFGRTDTIPAHDADVGKVNTARDFVEERIALMEQAAFNKRMPQDQRQQLQQSATMLKNLLSLLVELKTYEADPAAFSQHKAGLVEALRQPAFLTVNYPIHYLVDYCISILA